MPSSFGRLIAVVLLGAVLAATAAAQSEGARWLDVQFPFDSPVLPVSFSLGPTTARVKGMSMALELHASLLIRNNGRKPLSGLTLRVEAQDLTPAGKGSVTTPSLDILPGEVFPVKIDMELLRPFNVGKSNGAMVQVSLDCALFNDLTSYGPDKLGSRRSLMVYELQARRDRQYLAELLKAKQLAQLREELNFGLRDFNPQRIGLELLRNPPSVQRSEQALSVSAVRFPNAPVQAVRGSARIAGNEIRSPHVEVKNNSAKPVQSIDMGWIIRDGKGRDFAAGSIPANLRLAPVETGTMSEPGILRFSSPVGQPMLIEGLSAFVSDVEFSDGKLWIPSRSDIEAATSDPALRRVLATSPEQQRLAEIYRRKGISGLADELRRTN
jgi:hypothetical protein